MKNFTFLVSLFFISFSASAQVTFDWRAQSISPDNNLQEMNIVNDTTTLLVGYGRTFVKSADLGLTWDKVPILDPLYDFGDLSINSNGIGYACAGDQKVIDNPSGGEQDVYAQGVLLKTTDHGVSWSVFDISVIGEGDDPALNPSAPGCYAMHFRSCEVVDDNIALLGIEWYYYEVSTGDRIIHKGAFKTVDGGVSWIAITNNGLYPAVIEIADTSIYFGGSNHLLRTATGSDVVTDIYPNLIAVTGDATVSVYDFAIVSENEIYVLTSVNGAYKTLDRGETFTKLDGTGVPTGGYGIYSVNDSVLVILGTSTKSKVTTDYGATWTSCYPVPEPDPKPTFWDIGGVYNDSLYGLAKSKVWKIAVADLINGTYTTWAEQVLTDGVSLQTMHITDADRALIIGNDETFKITDDGGVSWTDIDLPELFVYGAEYDFADISTSAGASYASTRRFKQFECADVNVYGYGLIYKSMDYWGTWERLDVGNIGDDSSIDPSVNPYMEGCYGLSPTELECINDTVVYVYVNWADTIAGADNRIEHSRVYKTTDGGDTWDHITDDFGSKYIKSIYFIDSESGYIVGNQVLLKTIDGGDSFTDIYTALTEVDPDDDDEFFLNEIHYIDENEWYIPSVSDGVFATNDGGASYMKFTGISGSNGFYKVDTSTYVVMGNSTRSQISWDKGETWTDCFPGTTTWGIGGVLNDSLVAMAKTYLYKIALTNLAIPCTETDILSFVLDEQTGDAVINTTDHTITIEVGTGTDVTALKPVLTLSEDATVTPDTSLTQDFTNPVTYTVTAEDGTTTQEWVVTVTILVSTPDIPVSNISLYPNPVKNKIYLSNLEETERIVIISILGEAVIDLNSDHNNMEIDVCMLAEGMYFISFFDKDGVVSTKKLIKE